MLLRPGLSRAEVLVVLAITALVGTLTVTAIGHLREAAAHQRCRNNLKQLALGLHDYQSATDSRLPPLICNDLQSVFAILTPYLEAGPRVYVPKRSPAAAYHAHSMVPFTFTHKDGSEGTQYGGDANQTWRLFLDPADWTASGLRDVPITLPDGTSGHFATGSYVVNGLLPWGTEDKMRSALVLLPSTILIAERPQVCRTASGEVVYNLWGIGFYSPHMPAFAALTPADPPGLWSTAQVAPVHPPTDAGRSESGSQVHVRIGRAETAPQYPDFNTPVQIIRGNLPCDARLPGSPHRAGMQVVMGDGSVRLYRPNTTAWVFWSACAPAPRPDSTARP